MKTVKRDLIATCVRSCVAMVALCLGALHAGAAINITSNTQLSGDTDYLGQGVVTIADGVTLDLNGHKLFVDGLAGAGTVTDSTQLGADLIKGGSFEDTVITGNSGAWGYVDKGAAANQNWATDVPASAGYTKKNSPWVFDVKGDISALVQKNGNLYQTVAVPEAGDYALTYSYKSRTDSRNNKLYASHELKVKVDGKLCGKTCSAADWAVNTVVLHLVAGNHKIEFVGYVAGTDDATTILDDVSLRKIPAAGELHVVVPDGQTAEVSSVKLEGSLKLVKEGTGTYLVSYRNGGVKTWYLGGTSVKVGCLKVHPPANEASQSDYNFFKVQQLGAQGSEITVDEGATFDYGGNYDGFVYTVVLDGGTFGNLGTFGPLRATGTPFCVRLTADSFAVGLNTQLGETDLAGYTLDSTSPSNGSLFPCGTIRNGTLISRGGRFYPRAVDCSTVDLVLDGVMSCYEGTIPVHDLKVTSTSGNFGHGNNYYTVSGTYTPVSDLIHRYKLLNGSTINLSVRATPLTNPTSNGLFFEENARIFVDLGSRQVDPSELLIAWTAKPTNVEFCTVPGVDGSFRILDEGLVFAADDERIPVVAHWTGKGDVTDVSDPNNWACTNKYGRAVENAIPEADSTVYLPREISFNPAGSSFTCKEVVLADDSTLLADCDLTGLKVAIDTTIDLKGHRLFVSELAGAGTVTDTTPLGGELITGGSFEAIDLQSAVWSFFANLKTTSEKWKTDVPDRAGFTKGKTTWTADVKGGISAFIQMLGNLKQTVTVPADGDYALTYSYKRRVTDAAGSKQFPAHAMKVVVDDSTRVCGRTDSGTDWAVNTAVLHLTAGEHTIKFIGLTSDDSATILDDVSLRKIPAAGELHVVVPDGQTAEVSSVKLEGVLKLVKEGAGTYLVSYRNGSGVKTWYVGGTSVKAGCLKVQPLVNAASQADYNFYLVQQLGAQGSEITVDEGATFDYGGNYDGYLYTVVLNGGTFGNLGTFGVNSGTPFYLRLTADSLVTSKMNTLLGETDLAGYTLDATTPSTDSLYICGSISNGRLISHGGRFYPRAVDCATVDLVLDGSMSCVNGTIPFHDLKVISTTASGFGHGNNSYTVSGTYTPVSDLIHRYKLLNGSTIDLSVRTTPLTNPTSNGLFFEENATVYVDLGARKVKSSEPLITWSAKPANVKFRAAPGTVGGFVAKDNGLYRSIGFNVIVR